MKVLRCLTDLLLLICIATWEVSRCRLTFAERVLHSERICPDVYYDHTCDRGNSSDELVISSLIVFQDKHHLRGWTST